MAVWCCYCATANVTWPKVNWNSFCCSLRSRSSAASTQTSPPSSLLELFSGQWLVCHRVWEPFWKQCHQSCPPLTPAASHFTWLWVWQRSPLCWRGRRGFWTGAGLQVRNEQPHLSDTFDAFDPCLLSIEFCPCSLQLCNQSVSQKMNISPQCFFFYLFFVITYIWNVFSLISVTIFKNGSNWTRYLILVGNFIFTSGSCGVQQHAKKTFL